jgi:energy-coupling factor transport system permease protein
MLASINYRPRGSIVERFDPRARWIFSLLTLFAIVQFWDARVLVFFFLLSITQYAASRLTWNETRRAWFILNLVVVVMVGVNTLITSAGTIGSVMEGGTPVLELNYRVPLVGWNVDFTLTDRQLWFALGQVLRIYSIAILFMVIPFTQSPSQYGVTFKGLGLSDRLAFTMDLAFRFIPTVTRDFSTTLDAQRARGYEIERGRGGLIAQIRKVAPLLIPVTMGSLLTGEDVVNAMDLRCFGLQKRTWIEHLQYHARDYALIAFSILVLAGSLVLRYGFEIGGDVWMPF